LCGYALREEEGGRETERETDSVSIKHMALWRKEVRTSKLRLCM